MKMDKTMIPVAGFFFILSCFFMTGFWTALLNFSADGSVLVAVFSMIFSCGLGLITHHILYGGRKILRPPTHQEALKHYIKKGEPWALEAQRNLDSAVRKLHNERLKKQREMTDDTGAR